MPPFGRQQAEFSWQGLTHVLFVGMEHHGVHTPGAKQMAQPERCKVGLQPRAGWGAFLRHEAELKQGRAHSSEAGHRRGAQKAGLEAVSARPGGPEGDADVPLKGRQRPCWVFGKRWLTQSGL